MAYSHALPRTVSSLLESSFNNQAPDFDSNGQEIFGFDVDLSSLEQAKVENMNFRSTVFNEHPMVLGLKSGSSVSMAQYLTGSGTNAAEDASATATELSNHLLAAWGGRSLNYATGLDSSSAATVDVDTGEGSNYEQGDLIYVYDDSEGEGHWLIVQSVSTDTLTVDRTFPFTATTSDSIKGVIQCYPDHDALGSKDDTNYKTMALAFKGVASEDYWECYGCKPSVEIDEITQGTLPVLRFTYLVTSFLWESLTADDLSGAPEGEAPNVIGTGNSCKFFLADVGDNLAEVDAFSIQPRFGITHTGVDGPNGSEGRHGFIVDGLDCGLDVTVEFDDDYGTDYRAETTKHALIQIGNAETGSVCIYFPRLEYSSEPRRSGENNVSIDLTFRALLNTASSGSLTGQDLARWKAPFHVGMVA